MQAGVVTAESGFSSIVDKGSRVRSTGKHSVVQKGGGGRELSPQQSSKSNSQAVLVEEGENRSLILHGRHSHPRHTGCTRWKHAQATEQSICSQTRNWMAFAQKEIKETENSSTGSPG